MAFKAKDGKQFGNRQRMQAYDERKAMPKDRHQEPTAEPEEAEGGDIHEFVAEHGPADKIEMTHDDESGQHNVTSHHGGKKHHSTHSDRDAAHMHAAHASGLNPDGGEQPRAETAAVAEHYAIPGV